MMLSSAGATALARSVTVVGLARTMFEIRRPVLWALVPPLGAALALGWNCAVLLPSYSLPHPEPYCRPPELSNWIWAVSHTLRHPWQALGLFAVVMGVVYASVGAHRHGVGSVRERGYSRRSGGVMETET